MVVQLDQDIHEFAEKRTNFVNENLHNHLAISDLVSIRWIWKVWILENLYSGKVFVLWLFREKEGGLQVVEVEGEVEEVHVDRSEKIPSQGGGLLAGHLPSKLPLILTENSTPAALLKFIFVFVFVLCYFRLDDDSAILLFNGDGGYYGWYQSIAKGTSDPELIFVVTVTTGSRGIFLLAA